MNCKKPQQGHMEDAVFAEQLNAALESTKQIVSNLNEALSAKPAQESPSSTATAPSCPDEGKSA